jgi:hypothetical protein
MGREITRLHSAGRSGSTRIARLTNTRYLKPGSCLGGRQFSAP